MTSTSAQSRAAPVVGLAAGAALALSAGAVCWELQRRRRQALLHQGCQVRVRVLFGTTTGTSEKYAKLVAQRIEAEGSRSVVVEDLKTFRFDELLAETPPGHADVVLVLMSTESLGAPPDGCGHFLTLLDDHVHDFRVGVAAFSHLRFAVAGFGSSNYEAAGHFCTAAAKVDEGFRALGGKAAANLVRVCDQQDVDEQLEPWVQNVFAVVRALEEGGSVPPTAQQEVAASTTVAEEDDDYISSSESEVSDAPEEDLEDLQEGCAGDMPVAAEKAPAVAAAPREMVTKRQRAQLVKEGYKIIGSHSAVKLCRWTKHMLRGQGGCYKHSFYGIASYSCMEATPSLACANKCTFCWRHHKNPTGTEWKWRTDPPEEIVAEGVRLHRQMIKECKGIPGVKPERLEEAMAIQHCALSLVGEPIMYPHINEMVDELHRRHISTFFVTNAQFPEQMRALKPVTQLYVSIDAPNKEALKAIDRPLFQDFWERYLESLRILKEKRQRTTYRLTLVKGQNMEDAEGYAKLIALGEPDLIEIKSMTFCGDSKTSSLAITNVPWHEEVKNFSETMLGYEGLAANYSLACEHQHSNIVLLAHKRLCIEGKWHTWIDYPRFFECIESGKDFSAEDYFAPTPDWALYGSVEAGFDPNEKRKFHNRTKRKAQAGLLSEQQLKRYPSDFANAGS